MLELGARVRPYVYIDDCCSGVWTSLTDRPASGLPPAIRELYPNSSIYNVLEILIFNSLKFYSFIYIIITIKVIEV